MKPTKTITAKPARLIKEGAVLVNGLPAASPRTGDAPGGSALDRLGLEGYTIGSG